MNAKKILTVLCLAVVMSLSFTYRSVAAINTTTAVPADSTKDAAIAANIINRVNEIDNMDKTNLSPSEKKALRKELKGLKTQAEGLDSKVYLSVGAIIIIILLLILILR